MEDFRYWPVSEAVVPSTLTRDFIETRYCSFSYESGIRGIFDKYAMVFIDIPVADKGTDMIGLHIEQVDDASFCLKSGSSNHAADEVQNESLRENIIYNMQFNIKNGQVKFILDLPSVESPQEVSEYFWSYIGDNNIDLTDLQEIHLLVYDSKCKCLRDVRITNMGKVDKTEAESVDKDGVSVNYNGPCNIRFDAAVLNNNFDYSIQVVGEKLRKQTNEERLNKIMGNDSDNTVLLKSCIHIKL